MKQRLISSFNKFAKQTITYKRAVITDGTLNAIKTIGYVEETINNCVVKSAKPKESKEVEGINYGLRLNVIFYKDTRFEVAFEDRIVWKSDEYQITEFKRLEQIPGLHKTVIEIERI